MKKIIVFFVVIFITGCKSDINEKRIIDNTIVYGKVKTISQTVYCVKEKFGEMEKIGLPYISYSFFNEKTNLIKDSISDEMQSVSTSYNYDKVNKLLGKLHSAYVKIQVDTIMNQKHDTSANISSEKFLYSNANKKRKEIYKFNNHTNINVSLFDDENKLAEYNEYKSDGSLFKKHLYSYDSKNNLIEEVITGSVSTIINYSYDKKNNLIQKKVDGIINVNYRYKNFDKNGNWLVQNIEVINLKPNYGYNEFNIYGNWTELNFDGNSTYINEREIEYYK